MSLRAYELGTTAIRAGSLAEGARLLRIALKSGDLAPGVQALAYLWMAETSPEIEFKRRAYQSAVRAEPTNAEARTRLEALPAPAALPPSPSEAGGGGGYAEQAASGAAPAAQAFSLTPAPSGRGEQNPAPTLAAMILGGAAANAPIPVTSARDLTAAVLDGPNGRGTAFFIHPQGILATTRFVVGGQTAVTLEANGRRVQATIIRAFPELDLALLRADLNLASAWPTTPADRIPDEAALTAIPSDGQPLGGFQRPTRRAMADHWIATSFDTLPDAGGAPLFDGSNYLVGMLTRDTSRNADHLFALHIHAIVRALQMTLNAPASASAYCPSCGSGSGAISQGLYYCETCGAVSPTAQQVRRAPLPAMEAYFPRAAPCPRCTSPAGSHNGRCLRCGQSVA